MSEDFYEHNSDFKMKRNTSLIESHHNWYFEKSFSCSEKYDQFMNWLCVEFSFFQQDQGSFLTIYFPNGQVQVKREDDTGASFVSKISVDSKCRKVGLKIKKRLSEFLNHIEKYNKLNEIQN